MTNARDLTYGIALGAGLMFMFDPRWGAVRRSVIRQKATRTAHEIETAAGIGARDLEHRAEGIAARLSSLLRPHESSRSAPDDVLVARVRAELGHVCAHPRAIEVAAKGDGCIELKGPILRTNVDRVLNAISHVHGVKAIDDDLEVHEEVEHHPALLGSPMRARPMLLASPATRLILGIGGASVCVLSLLKGNVLGLVTGGVVLLGSAHSIAHRGRRRRGAALTPPSPPSSTTQQQVEGLREAHAKTGAAGGHGGKSEWAPPAEH